MFDFVGSDTLQNISEQSLLDNILALAVKGKKKSVHRKEFYGMSQAIAQNIESFVAKLGSKAVHCSFTFKSTSNLCHHQANSYADATITDQMVIGCADSDIQDEILAKDAQLTSNLNLM